MSESIKNKISPREILLSLDIGTRSVVGIVGKMEDEKFVIIDSEMIEHPSRAMYDGQIHDINRVAEVAKEVKENIEKRLGVSLKQVAIAAAGRALKTYKTQISREIDYSKEIDNNVIKSLELEGVQKAQERLEQESNTGETKYYCVGHTVVNYYLNDGIITSLKGHRGNKIGAEILATFLPYVVVDSLYSVMSKIDLEVMNLTLEPIAAIHAAIPPKLRLLNLALVDIGAGTSDIAITKDGTVVAYDMAAVAGDEITEALAKEFLLDFDSAERLKIELNKKETHSFKDIVGIPYTMSTEEIIERIEPAIEMLAIEISEKIIANNGKPPSAVFCIGGGSQIPMFTQILAEKLAIVKERVVVRGTEIIENIRFSCDKLEGPEYITPIGIGIVSLKNYEQDFIEVFVNESLVKLFNTKQLLVSDALIRMGFNARKLIARRGKSITIEVNGYTKQLLGGLGETAIILINNMSASLDSPIRHNDLIAVKSAVDGNDARFTMKEFIQELNNVSFNGVELKLINDLTVNGKEVSMDYLLQTGDRVVYKEIHYLKELLNKFNINRATHDIFVNNGIVGMDYKLRPMDKVTTQEKFILNNSAQKNSEVDDKIEVIVNDKVIFLTKKEKPPIFVDIFNHLDFDMTKPKGTLKLLLNGQRANYTDFLKNGDRILINWVK